MPNENKKRGPRGRRLTERKRKALAAAEDEREAKRSRQDAGDVETPADYIPLDFDQEREDEHVEGGHQQEDPALEGTAQPGEQPFYGMLDEDEQNYFRKADEMLDLNQFESPEERAAFLDTLYRDADGKELKLANSQSCSRLMERLIQLSTPSQLKSLFAKFSGNFIHLLQHRFASHCCEALFIQAAPAVTSELQNPISKPKTEQDQGNSDSDPEPGSEVFEPMETYFMNTLNELEEYLGFFMTQKWGSHALRVLLLVLAGESITRSTRKGPLQSRKKEGVQANGASKVEETLLERREVPETFKSGLEIFIARCVKGLNTDFLRALATHPTGNPTIQLLLQMELSHFGKQRAKNEDSIIHLLLPDDPITEGTGSASFINGLVYDPIGSRLLETIIEFAPAKTFKTIYREFFKERLATLARNDVASYVVIKVLTRLGKDELSEACDLLIPQIPALVEKNRIALIRALIERCNVRGVPTDKIASQLELTFPSESGFDVATLLKLNPTQSSDTKADPSKANGTTLNQSSNASQAPTNEKLHRSLLAQTMLSTPGPLSTLLYDSLSRLPPSLALSAAKDPNASHTLTAALASEKADIIHRRKLIQQFYGNIVDLALHPHGSRVIDAIWTGTLGLAFIRERVAEELAEAEQLLRQSAPGRKVWANWQMELYRRRRGEWVSRARASAGRDGFVGFPEGEHCGAAGRQGGHQSNGEKERAMPVMPPDGGAANGAPGKHLSAIERARQKHAMKREQGRGKGVKGVVPAV